jgi:hypothetical protein
MPDTITPRGFNIYMSHLRAVYWDNYFTNFCNWLGQRFRIKKAVSFWP